MTEKIIQRTILDINIINFLNENAGAISGVVAVLALLVSIIAIFLSLATNRSQLRLSLFSERYTVYNRFAQLIDLVDILTDKSFTMKGKLYIWNVTFFGMKTDSSELGAKILNYDEQLSELEIDSAEFKEVQQLRQKCASEKFLLDLSSYAKDKELLFKSRLLFSDEITEYIAEFLGMYDSAVMMINFAEESEIEQIFTDWRVLNDKIKEEKIIDKIDKYIMFLK